MFCVNTVFARGKDDISLVHKQDIFSKLDPFLFHCCGYGSALNCMEFGRLDPDPGQGRQKLPTKNRKNSSPQPSHSSPPNLLTVPRQPSHSSPPTFSQFPPNLLTVPPQPFTVPPQPSHSSPPTFLAIGCGSGVLTVLVGRSTLPLPPG